ncbi:MAG: NAD(P)-dependent oxidoreductase [Microcystis aeruginosa Ma_AC_P_19900807_S300]|nr:MAG: NAD(P)-dependent oxidoreductase [Microcystis aeruginosa Ma_AC_P_19900807_S300]
MTIAITGAFGFLGSELVKFLLHQTNHDIIAIVKSTTINSRLQYEGNRLQFFYSDISPLDQLYQQHCIDIVVHAATDYGRSRQLADVVYNNVVFPLQLLEYAKKYKVKLFINTDSYFTKAESEYTYLQTYTLTKRHFEDYVRHEKEIPLINIKLEHVFGIGDADTKFVTNIFKMIVAGKPEIDATEGTQKRDFIFVSDVVRLFYEVIINHERFEKNYYPIESGWGQSIAIRDFILKIKKVTGSRSHISFGSLPMRAGEIMDSFADLSLIPKFLKWRPCVTIDEALELMRNHYSQQTEF